MYSTRITRLMAMAGLVIACSEQTAPTAMPEANYDYSNNPHALSYSSIGDCSVATTIDPGTEKVVDGNLIIQGRTFDCPLTGDIEGTIRVNWHNAVFPLSGTSNSLGRVTGTTTLFVDAYFGRIDLEGTFEGPFSATLPALLVGEASLIRHGTGDFHGLVMHGVFYMDPPGSGTTAETGTISGR
jgi:hypothetical protein